MSDIQVLYDANGRQVMPGDLVRIPHYRDIRTGRQCFMYRIVFRVNDCLELDGEGRWLYGVATEDIHKFCSIQEAFKHRLDIGACEIIDGYDAKNNVTWYERPRQQEEADDE